MIRYALVVLTLLSSMSLPVLANEFGTVIDSVEPQKITLVQSGLGSLARRLEMIESAQKTIEVEFFIYDIDYTTRILSQALVKKAKEGVKVRILVDYSIPVFALNKYYATEMMKQGVEVKYYNKAKIYQFVKMQVRSHRKTLIVDDYRGMTGGRNFADEYFDLSPEYNFLDTDVLLEGSLAVEMRKSFDAFWNHRYAYRPKPEEQPVKPKYEYNNPTDKRQAPTYEMRLKHFLEMMNKAKDYFAFSEADAQLLQKVKTAGADEMNTEITSLCLNTTYVADTPGFGDDTRAVYRQIKEDVRKAEKSIDIESPYFVLKSSGFDLLADRLDKKITINVLTNSLYSTDAVYTVSAFVPRIPLLTMRGANVWVYDGSTPRNLHPSLESSSHARWGTHSKRAVIDGKTTIVGTFNVDPRSRNINSEMALICRDNEELASATLKDMEMRRNTAVVLGKDGRPKNGRSILFKAPVSKRVLFYMLLPFANLLDFLL